ncbi:hypothetical protein CRE_06328 [Caenorhabditis remanei]|uniref:Uncharacterized protein n=1 Tax=Caenorhabditis remanei TaxID=31234 RepID=E3M1E9_CAERE|nr:hypothetical protein CRE_06328 [Caenorhabditis remanei]
MQQNNIIAPYLASFLAPIAAPGLAQIPIGGVPGTGDSNYYPAPQNQQQSNNRLPNGPSISMKQTEGQMKVLNEMQEFIDQEMKKDRDSWQKSLRIEELEAINANLLNQFNILKQDFDKLKIENIQQKKYIKVKNVEDSNQKFKIRELEEDVAKKQRKIDKQYEKIEELKKPENERKEKLKVKAREEEEALREESRGNPSSSGSSTHVLTEIGLVEREVANYFPPEMFKYCLNFVKRPIQEVYRIPQTREFFNICNRLLPIEDQRTEYGSEDIYKCSKLRHFIKEKQKKELDQNMVMIREPVVRRPSRRKRSIQECAPSFENIEQAHMEFQKKFHGKND